MSGPLPGARFTGMPAQNMQVENQPNLAENSGLFESAVLLDSKLDDSRADLVEKARGLACSLDPNHAWSTMDNLAIMQHAGLARVDSDTGMVNLTVAGLLLVGKDSALKALLPYRAIEARAQALDPQGYDEQEIFQTNLIESYERLMAFVGRNLPENGSVPERPQVSVRDAIFAEIVSNMLIHRDYASSVSSRLILLRDRVTVENPCRTSRQGLIDLARSESVLKNPVIARFFRQIGFSGAAGSGMQVMKRWGDAYFGMEPLIFDRTLFKVFAPGQLASSSSFLSSLENMQDSDEAVSRGAGDTRQDSREVFSDWISVRAFPPKVDAEVKKPEPKHARFSETMHASSGDKSGMHDRVERESASPVQSPMQDAPVEVNPEPLATPMQDLGLPIMPEVAKDDMQVSPPFSMHVEPPVTPEPPVHREVVPTPVSAPVSENPPPPKPTPSVSAIARIQSFGARITNKVRWGGPIQKAPETLHVAPEKAAKPGKAGGAVSPSAGMKSVASKAVQAGGSGPMQDSVNPSMQGQPKGSMQDDPKAAVQAERIRKILIFCQTPRNREEIQNHVGLNNRDYFRKEILVPLLQEGRLVATIPDKPNSPKQQYKVPG
jgi:hypothetical protein